MQSIFILDALPQIVSLEVDNIHPSPDFAHHQRIRPILLHGRHRLEIPNTRQSVSTIYFLFFLCTQCF